MKYTLRIIIYSLFIWTIPLTGNAQSFAESQKDSIWHDFRAKYPNPFQIIGFSQFEDNSQLYLIAEPAPHVKIDDVKKIFDGFDYSIDIKQWKIGYDGWVKDILITVNYIPEVYKFELIEDLNELMFFTDYKPMYLVLPATNTRKLFLENDINYKISAASLNKWFVEDNMPFFELSNQDKKVYFKDILDYRKSGVFMSVEPNFVIWSIPKNSDISHRKGDLWKFLIDSDVILGAISNSNTLVIIGRERQNTFSELPPLRIETVTMLAATKDKDLSQSLNIAELITGKMENGADWCPAFLSDELENDELGHLLTMTDIFLKDWLIGGKLSYLEYAYPKPNHYYYVKSDGMTSIRYNWNTNDYIYQSNFYDKIIIAFNNTACLNASLFDASEVDEKNISTNINKEVNKYFARLNNVDLARVAQYTALYQIFKANGIGYSAYSMSYTKNKSSLLLNDTRNILSKLRNLSNTDIRIIAQKIEEDYFDLYLSQELQMNVNDKTTNWEKEFEKAATKAAMENSMSIEEFKTTQEYKDGREKNLKQFRAQIDSFVKQSKEQTISQRTEKMYVEIESLRNKLTSLSYEDFDKLCNYVAYPNGYHSDYSQMRNLSKEITKLYWPIWINGKYFGINMEKVKNNYVDVLKNDHATYLKTPKIVVTDNSVGKTQVKKDVYITIGGSIGGHSLNSKINTQSANTERPQSINEGMKEKYSWNTNVTPKEEYIPKQPGNSGTERAYKYARAAGGEAISGGSIITVYENSRRSVDNMNGSTDLSFLKDDPNFKSIAKGLEQVLKQKNEDITKKEDIKRTNNLPPKERLINIRGGYEEVKQILETEKIQVTPEQKKTLDKIYNYTSRQLSENLPKLEQRIETVIRPAESQKKEEKIELPKEEEEDLSALEERLARAQATLLMLKQQTVKMKNENQQKKQ